MAAQFLSAGTVTINSKQYFAISLILFPFCNAMKYSYWIKKWNVTLLDRMCTETELNTYLDHNKTLMSQFKKQCPQYCSDYEVAFGFPNKLPKVHQGHAAWLNMGFLYIRFPNRIDRVESLEGLTFLGRYLSIANFDKECKYSCCIFRCFRKCWW